MTTLVPIDLGVVPVTALRLAQEYAEFGSGAEPPIMFFAGPDDNSCVWFSNVGYCNNPQVGQQPGWGKGRVDIFVVDISGATTWYSTGPQGINGANNCANVSSIIPLGGGVFVLNVANGLSYTFRVGNLKLNNAAPISIAGVASLLSNPCYPNQTPQRYFYDSVQKYLAVGWYNLGADGGPVYSSTYNVVTSGGLEPYILGYAGHYIVASTNYDPWDRTGVTGGVPTSNGMFVALANDPQTGNKGISQTSVNVYPGNAANCVTPNGAYVTSNLKVSQYSNLNTGGTTALADSNIPGVYGFSYSGNGLIYLFTSIGLLFSLTTSGSSGFLEQAVLTRKNLFIMTFNANGDAKYGNIYGGALAGNGSQNPYGYPSLTKTKFGLSNYSRPISVTGKFKA
jgi:hypothetical protein